MLQRIYGTAFATREALDEHLTMLEEAKKRDHRRLGQDLELFFFDDEVGPGLPLWQPKGTVLIEELERLAKETEREAGYLQVRTPHICKDSMFVRSGHLPYYAESMFPPMEMEGVNYYLKPMNCPPTTRCSPRSRAATATCRCGSPSTGPATATSSRGSCSA